MAPTNRRFDIGASASVQHTDEGSIVRIATCGDDLCHLTVTINGGELFDDYPEFALDPGWRKCPECGVGKFKHAIYFCAWCGVKQPDYEEV